ncbi:unnamed protein product [Linum tenue]|uniref:Disease resistance R13L4/SHOC-2-like LRR domain-containing protein n=1 Tax=Linum tenue TaxID=586396 RepID=A0AAV0IHI7_9ROSI|nr:unnamed protein product [Linum tenue]
MVCTTQGDPPIEGIVLDDDWWSGAIGKPDGICVQADVFEEMENLRFLVIGHNAFNLVLPKDGLKCVSNMLRILEWDSFPSRCLPPKFSAENLVTLGLTCSKIERLWEHNEFNVDLGNLKTLNLKGSKSLRKLPDLSTAKRLESMHLSGCVSLEELPTSVLDLPLLETLHVSECISLKWDNLEDYVNCSPEQSSHPSGILPSLKFVNLAITPIQKVPSFITHSPVLTLDCADCTELTEFAAIPSLERLDLTYSLIDEVVELEKLTKLKHLNLSQNKHLIILISGDFPKSNSLEMIALESCTKLSRLPRSIGNLLHLTNLDLSRTALEELPSSIGDLTLLSELLLTGCKSLVCLPDTIHKLSNLNILKLDHCYQLCHLPMLPSSLKDLDAHGCKSLKTMSTDTAEAQMMTLSVPEYTRWCFGWCWELDPVACSKMVDKFTQDLVRCPKSSHLLVPAKWVSNSSSEEGSIMGSSYKSRATAKLHGQPWKLKSLFFCILLNTLPLRKLQNSYMNCFLINNDDDKVTLEMKTSTISWLLRGNNKDEEEDEDEELLSNDHLLLWSADRYTDTVRTVQRVAEKAVRADGATIEFSFHGRYSSKEEGTETSILIKNCRVIPVYEDRVVTYEEEEEDQYPVNLRGLYDQMCSGQ